MSRDRDDVFAEENLENIEDDGLPSSGSSIGAND
jgi:hypothetical protein